MRKIAFLLIAGFVGFGAYAEGQIINKTVIECDGEECARRPRSSEIVGGCDDAEPGTNCTQSSGRAKTAKCVEIKVESDGDKVKSCAAKECNDNYWLWVSGGHSMGVCHSIEETIRFCKKNGTCSENCDCVPNEIPNPNRGYGGKAYDECHCVPKQSVIPPVVGPCDHLMGAEKECCLLEKVFKQPVRWNKEKGICECTDKDKELKDGQCVDKNGGTPDVEGDCRYTFRGAVTCNGKRVFKFTSFKLTAQQAKDWKLPSCKPGETIFVEERYKQDVENFRKLRDEVCGKPQSHLEDGWITYDNDGGNDYEYLDAKNRIDAFMRSASSNASVWKNAEGQFNTARLASDLTAGVVLGTVGGIVSANVIKKKQLEKGFDALHCTVGGQTVADWGDEFSVGFRRY